MDTELTHGVSARPDPWRGRSKVCLAVPGMLLLMHATTGCAVVHGIQARAALEQRCNFSRAGHCADVRINGQTTAPMSKRTRALLAEDGWDAWMRSKNCKFEYETPLPVAGAIEVDAEWKPEEVEHFGSPARSQIGVKPLDAQVIETSAQLQSSPTVRVNGSAVVTRADVVRDNRLPPGRYLFEIRLYGAKSDWDCQGVFVQVAA